MNIQLEETLNSILTKSIELAEKSGEFIIEQGGDLLQEFCMWYTTKHILGIILGVIVIFILPLIARVWGKATKENDDHIKILGKWHDSEDGGGFATIVLSIIIALVGGGIVIKGVYNLCFITIAPKLYLLDHFIN